MPFISRFFRAVQIRHLGQERIGNEEHPDVMQQCGVFDLAYFAFRQCQFGRNTDAVIGDLERMHVETLVF